MRSKQLFLSAAVLSAALLTACGAERLTLLSDEETRDAGAVAEVLPPSEDRGNAEPEETAEQPTVSETTPAPEPIPHPAESPLLTDFSTPTAEYDNYEIYYYDANFILLINGANNATDDFTYYPVPDDCHVNQPKIPEQYNHPAYLLKHDFDYSPSSYSKYEDKNDYISTYRTIAEYGPLTETEMTQEDYRVRSIVPKQLWYGAEIYSIFTKEGNPYSVMWEQSSGAIVGNWYFRCSESDYSTRLALCSSKELKSYLTLAESYIKFDETDEYLFSEDDDFILFFVSGDFRTESYLPGIEMGAVQGELVVVFDKVYGDLLYQYVGTADADRAAELVASVPGCYRIRRNQ